MKTQPQILAVIQVFWYSTFVALEIRRKTVLLSFDSVEPMRLKKIFMKLHWIMHSHQITLKSFTWNSFLGSRILTVPRMDQFHIPYGPLDHLQKVLHALKIVAALFICFHSIPLISFWLISDGTFQQYV